MTSIFQRCLETLPALEAWVARSWVGQHPAYDRSLSAVYGLYKRYVEDELSTLFRLRPDLLERGAIMDVGGGLGYTGALFARTAPPGTPIHVFEPAPDNARRIRAHLRATGLEAKAEVFETAVGEREETAWLALNPRHRADHRIARASESSVPVNMVRLDRHLDRAGLKPGFVKIDVQGGEPKVLDGMGAWFGRVPVWVEFHPPSLSASGQVPKDFLARLRAGQQVRIVEGGRLVTASDARLEARLRSKSYADVLVEPEAKS